MDNTKVAFATVATASQDGPTAQAFVNETMMRLGDLESRLNRMADRICPTPRAEGGSTRPEEVPSGYASALSNIVTRIGRIESTLNGIENYI